MTNKQELREKIINEQLPKLSVDPLSCYVNAEELSKKFYKSYEDYYYDSLPMEDIDSNDILSQEDFRNISQTLINDIKENIREWKIEQEGTLTIIKNNILGKKHYKDGFEKKEWEEFEKFFANYEQSKIKSSQEKIQQLINESKPTSFKTKNNWWTIINNKVKIWDINSLKNAEYNGKLLTNEEKTVFDSSFLKVDKRDKYNLDEIIKVAILLDNVKEAETILPKNSERIMQLLIAMENASNDQQSNLVAFKTVNSYNEQINKAMNRLRQLLSEFEENNQGIKGVNEVDMEEEFKSSWSNITTEGKKHRNENNQGITSGGRIKVKGFEIKNPKIVVGKNVKSKEEIKDEISSKERQLKRKNERYEVYATNNDSEGMERVEKEIEILEEQIREIKSKLQTARIQVDG